MINLFSKSGNKIFRHSGIALLFTAALLAACVFQGCENKQQPGKKPVQIDSTAIKDSLARLEEENYKVTYHYFPEKGRITYSGLKNHFNDEELKIILGINRLDRKNFGRRDSVIVPDTFLTDFNRYSPFPRKLEIAEPVKKLILFSYTIQSYAAYENGTLVRWGPTSLGKRSTPTPLGLYHTNWKAKKTISTINPEWILPWAFNLDNHEGVSMHQFDLPGYPASHACARLWEEDAQWFYYWAEQWVTTKDQEDVRAYGTPVIIYGKYGYGKRPPWRFLPQNPDITKESAELVTSVVKDYINTIVNRQEERVAVLTEIEKEKAEELEKKKTAELEKKRTAENKNSKSGGRQKTSSAKR